MSPSPILTPDELHALTGYRRPAQQLQVLHAQGYWRARRSVLGPVILERPHFEAVAAGRDTRPPEATRPRLRLAGA